MGLLKRHSKTLSAVCMAGMLAVNAGAVSFVDEHSDGQLTEWEQLGRNWVETNGFATPVHASNSNGFLLYPAYCTPNGTLEVTINADQWNGYRGGVVFRFTNFSSYYFASVHVGISDCSYIKLYKGTTYVNNASAITVAQGFSVGTTFTLKIVMTGNKFDFYLNGIEQGSVTDNAYSNGMIGYAYSNEYNDYINFDRIQWTETQNLPSAPSNVQLSVDATSKVNINWEDNSSNESEFCVERSSNGGSFSEITRLAANVTSFMDESTVENSSYSYRVRAYNNAGYSNYSGVTEIKTIPSTVTNLQISTISDSKLNITWNDNSAYEDGFSIERKINGARLYEEIFRTGPNVTSFLDEGLIEDKLYIYRIRAFNQAGYSGYSGTVSGTTLRAPERFLILVGAELYRQGTIVSDLELYRQDILAQGWKSKLVIVSKTDDHYANQICPDEKSLKHLIKSYYEQGVEGYVIIGSPKEVPSAYWRYHENDTGAKDLSDLYFADTSEWADLDTDGVYETLHSKYDGNKWVEDLENPANPNNYTPLPELFYARICADTSVSIQTEATLVSNYLHKVHQYRVNGTNLTSDQMRRSFYLANACYARGAVEPGFNVQNATPDINILAGYTLLFPERIQAELSKGYKYAQIITHSGNNSHVTSPKFTIEHLNACNPKVLNVNMFACHAADFNLPNFAATYIFNSDYTLAATGSTGGWGTWMDSTYYAKLNAGLTVGETFKDWMVRVAGHGAPKGILLGDPLVSFSPAPLANRPPAFSDMLFSHEATAGVQFTMDILGVDPEGDPVWVTLEDLPSGAQFNGTTLIWTPDISLAGTTDTIIATVADNHNNTTTQAFTLYISHFKNGNLVDTTSWDKTGAAIFWNSLSQSYYTPQGVDCRGIVTENNWGKLQQSISVKPNNRYRLLFSTKNELTVNSNYSYLRIEELDKNIFISKSSGDEFSDKSFTFKTYDNTSITISLCNGNQDSLTTGNMFFTALKLKDLGPVSMGLQNGDFENAVLTDWSTETSSGENLVSSRDVLGREGFCAMLWHYRNPNASSFNQEVRGLVPGATYRMSGWIKGDSITGNTSGAYMALSDNSARSAQSLTGSFDWTYTEFSFTAPQSGIVTVALKLGSTDDLVTGLVRFDDISLVQIP